MNRTFVMVLRCTDQPGIVHEVTGGLLTVGANIIENAQFTDPDTETFVMRTRFVADVADTASVIAAISSRSLPAGFVLRVRPEDNRYRAMIMVSRQDHCLLDLLYRHKAGELDIDIPLVVSNHTDCADEVAIYNIPFVHLPITPETKPAREADLLDLIERHEIDVVILARYMQVLSDEMCRAVDGRAINIHHSFLPGFKGARPYHQAHERGVKLIGATAHYITPDLDEGPIIEQDVVRVSHVHSAADLVRIGRDVERSVLSRAVHAHAQDRVVLIGDRTIVFS